MRQSPLDDPTYVRAVWALGHARTWGHDPVEELHAAGLILTPAKELAIKIMTLEFIAAEIDNWRTAEFVRRSNKTGTGATAADLHREIVAFIQEHIITLREAP